MVLIEIKSQHKEDFIGTIRCEHCQHTTELKEGKDTVEYHRNVLTNIKCVNCGESTKSRSSN
jgi:C4-type Zn-finger protein